MNSLSHVNFIPVLKDWGICPRQLVLLNSLPKPRLSVPVSLDSSHFRVLLFHRFRRPSFYVVQASLQLMIFMLQLPECWDSGQAPAYLTCLLLRQSSTKCFIYLVLKLPMSLPQLPSIQWLKLCSIIVRPGMLLPLCHCTLSSMWQWPLVCASLSDLF